MIGRIDDVVLQGHGFVFRTDAFQIPGGGMTGIAVARAIEIYFAGFRVPGDDIEDLILIAIGGRGDRAMQEVCDIDDLLGRQIEFGHAFIRAAFAYHLADALAALVIKHENGAEKVRAFLAPFGVSAMTEAAGGYEIFLSALDGSRIELHRTSGDGTRLRSGRGSGCRDRRLPQEASGRNKGAEIADRFRTISHFVSECLKDSRTDAVANKRVELVENVGEAVLGRLCMLLLAWTALPAAAQLPLSPAQARKFSGIFEPSGQNNDLKCHVDELKPFFDFAFRFEAGYVVRCPVAEFGGKQTTVATLLRIRAENRKPVMLGQSFVIPGIPPASRAKTNLKHLHNDLEFSGVFATGEGNYQVDFAVFDDQKRVYRKSWKIHAEAHGKEREAAPSIAGGGISPVVFPPWEGTTDDGTGLHLTVLLDAAPKNPYSMHLRAWDRAFLLGSLSSLLRRVPVASVKLVAFNLDQQQEIFRDEDFDRTGFFRLSMALSKLELGTISYQKLERHTGWEDLLCGLIRTEAEVRKPSDAVVFLGPTNRMNQRIPSEFLAPSKNADLPFFYFEYYPMLGREFPDAIQHAVEARSGTTYKLYSPGDLAESITKMQQALVTGERAARMTQ